MVAITWPHIRSRAIAGGSTPKKSEIQTQQSHILLETLCLMVQSFSLCFDISTSTSTDYGSHSFGYHGVLIRCHALTIYTKYEYFC